MQLGGLCLGSSGRWSKGWKLRRPCPAFQPTCLAPASGAFRGPRGVAALLRGRAEGRVGRAQQRSTGLDSCLGQASLRSLLPWSTSPLQVSLPTETKDLLEGGR